ncbi:ABC transporter ATP-binding protein [Streptomyces avermitilis]|uniref:ABC transporter ATP-binding protein n=1 Tax=Streptomyces avermitilis TaxID=33903 RepID=UPI0033F84F24
MTTVTGPATRRLAVAASLAWRAAPGTLCKYLALALAAAVLPVAGAWLTKLLLDGLMSKAAPGDLVVLAVGLAVTGVVTGVQPQLAQYLRAELDRAVTLLSQDRLFQAVDGFAGLCRFEDPRFLDRLRLAQQTGAAPYGNQAIDGILGVVRSGVTIAGFFGSLVLLSPMMAGLVLLAGAPTLVAELLLSRRRARMLWDLGPVERREAFYGDLLSTVEAAKEIRLFGTGTFFRCRMTAQRRVANAAKHSMDQREVIAQVALAVLAALVAGAGLLWAVGAARAGSLSVGDVTIFVAAVAGVQGALAALAGEMARAHQALLLFDHYVSVTTAGPDLVLAKGPVPPLRDGIELRDVWFRYSPDHPWVLRGVTLRIPHGTAVALVGLNGAGKSTLVKLLCRFYDPTKGAILWDGVDIRDVDVTQLRSRIGAVFQDYMHYDLTARESIALGDLDALDDDARIESAAHRAGIHDRLAGLPRGYRTLLSRMFFMKSEEDVPEKGVVLSGGEWQRVALARAFLRDGRDLMILDEPSAGLDAEAEHEIHTSLRQTRQGRTSLLISHRLGALRDAGLIVVLADGRIVEQGTHTTLLAEGSAYAHLFGLQAAGYRGEPGAPAWAGGQ